jgi:putative flippase GtrA
MTARVSQFVVIGMLGFAVQMAVAAVLLAAGLSPLLATALAIEAAIVHNHAWHRRWAWRDRTAGHAWPRTLWRAHLGVGGASLAMGLVTVAVLRGRVSPAIAQAIAVGLCATANFLLADRWVFRSRPEAARAVPRGRVSGAAEAGNGDEAFVGRPSGRSRPRPSIAAGFVAVIVIGVPALVEAGPSPKALQSWQRYAAALAAARQADSARGVPTWAVDGDPGGATTLAALRRGEFVVVRRRLPRQEVDDATLEHWQGSVLLRGVTLQQVTHRLRHPDTYPQPPDVRALQVSGRTDDGHDLYLRLTRSLIVSATYDTWHHVRHSTPRPGQIESVSEASRIQEVDDPGTTGERRLPADDGRGFLWRMQSFWRFTATPDGVVVTCESITLSRPVPFGLGLVSRPAITRVARESMTTAIRAWQRGWRPVAS